MAQEPSQTIYIPELNRPTHQSKATGNDLARMELNTYANNGRIWSCASVTWQQPDGAITCELCGDYRKSFPAVRGVRATQKALDEHHKNTFTNTAFDALMAEVRAFYKAKQKDEEDAA